MSVTYYYRRNGQDFGPVTGSALKELAAAGRLTGDDLIRRDGMEKWERASRIKGLFPAAAAAGSEPEFAVPRDAAVAQPGEPLAAAVPQAAPPSGSSETSNPAQPKAGWTSRVSPVARKYADALEPLARRQAQEFGLGFVPFLACVAGAACLLLLALSTLLTWDTYYEDLNSVNYSIAIATAGLEAVEGKAVAFMSVAAVGLFAATYFVKRLLPIGLLVAGAAATCSLVLAISYKHSIDRYNDDIAEADQAASTYTKGMLGEEGGEAVMEKFIPREADVAGLGLYLAICAGLVAVPAFIFAALSKPLPLPFLQGDSVHPFARRHGALLISQGAALLAGIAGYILRF